MLTSEANSADYQTPPFQRPEPDQTNDRMTAAQTDKDSCKMENEKLRAFNSAHQYTHEYPEQAVTPQVDSTHPVSGSPKIYTDRLPGKAEEDHEDDLEWEDVYPTPVVHQQSHKPVDLTHQLDDIDVSINHAFLDARLSPLEQS